MPEFMGIGLRGLVETQAALAKVYPACADAGVETANVYLINELKIYPPYSYVSVAEAGGWKSERQRRYVMARIAEGTIRPGVPNRTQRLAEGWHLIGDGQTQTISNNVDYSIYEYAVGQQARMHELQGWRVIPELLAYYHTELVFQFGQGVNRAFSQVMAEGAAAGI